MASQLDEVAEAHPLRLRLWSCALRFPWIAGGDCCASGAHSPSKPRHSTLQVTAILQLRPCFQLQSQFLGKWLGVAQLQVAQEL